LRSLSRAFSAACRRSCAGGEVLFELDPEALIGSERRLRATVLQRGGLTSVPLLARAWCIRCPLLLNAVGAIEGGLRALLGSLAGVLCGLHAMLGVQGAIAFPARGPSGFSPPRGFLAGCPLPGAPLGCPSARSEPLGLFRQSPNGLVGSRFAGVGSNLQTHEDQTSTRSLSLALSLTF